MIPSRGSSSGRPFRLRFLQPLVFLLCLNVFFSLAQAETAPYKIEIRLTEEPSLQLADNQGKVWQSLPMGSVRKRVNVQGVPLLGSFGKDSQHRLIIMLGLDITQDQPVSFLFGNNIIVASPEAILTFQLSPDQSSAEINPSLMGKIWVNGILLSRGETKNLPFHLTKGSAQGIVPSPDQPKPSVKDFQAIAPPSI